MTTDYNVLAWKAIKDEKENELNELLKTRSCKINENAKCNIPRSMSCSSVDCPVWKEIDGE